MLSNRGFRMKHGTNVFLVLGAVVAALAFAPDASAGVHVGFGFNFTVPPGVHVSASSYEPYYVGRVFYEPAGVWRPVYSFPVETEFGIVYRPYVYDGGYPVCSGYILGPAYGYSTIVIDGRGHFEPRWYHGPYYRGGHYYSEHRYHGWDRHDHASHHGRHGRHEGGHR